MMPQLLAHITSLTFHNIPVTLQDFENGSNPGYCHQNCFNYQKKYTDAEILRGWLENKCASLEYGYVLHSIIRHNNQLLDPTPFIVPSLRGNFAIDNSIIWNNKNEKDWEFEIPGIGTLPRKL